MKLSIHPQIKGKPPKDSNLNLGFGWVNVEAEWPDVFALITEDGYATSAELTCDNRRDTNFVSRQLLMVDIDSGMTIPQLLDDPFYNEYGAGFYATPSFTLEHHKFRILFVTEQPITDSSVLRKINRALLKVFAQADAACKDPARLFYGSPNCEIKEIRDNILTNEIITQLCSMVDAFEEEEMRKYVGDTREYTELSDERKRTIVELLKGIYVGNYPIWRNIAWGMKQGGFTLQDFQYVTTGMMNRKSAKDAAAVWTAGKADGDVTMGSVIYLLKQHYGEGCLGEVSKEEWALEKYKEKLAKKYLGE